MFCVPAVLLRNEIDVPLTVNPPPELSAKQGFPEATGVPLRETAKDGS